MKRFLSSPDSKKWQMMTSANKSVYKGALNDAGEPHGKGTCEYGIEEDPLIAAFEGGWINGCRNFGGIVEFREDPSRTKWRGEWKEGKLVSVLQKHSVV